MQTSSTHAIDIQHLDKSFGDIHAVRDLSFHVRQGELFAFLGVNGAGKSTTISILCGLLAKDGGTVTVCGQDADRHMGSISRRLGIVFQNSVLDSALSVRDNLRCRAALYGITGTAFRERLAELSALLDLDPLLAHPVGKLSGGQRKRLSIAMEFISNPSLFILDEPDSGLDGVMARELFEQLRLIADQGKIIIVITHTPDRVIDLFDDVIVLAKDAKRTGRLAYFGPIDEARAFFGKESMEEIVKSVNRQEEGGEGRADEFILKYAEVQHG